MSPDLERDLLALRDEIAWPPTPDLAAAVQARVAAEPPAPRVSRRRWWLAGRGPLAPALAAVLVVLVAFAILLAASPGVRATLRDWLGIGSVRITRVQTTPPAPPGQKLDLGRHVNAAAASRALGRPVATVGALGAPAAIYLGLSDSAVRVSLVYKPRAGLPAGAAGVGAILDEVQAEQLFYAEKFVHSDVPITEVDVGGARGYFVGGEHTLTLPGLLRPRIAGNTVIWVRDGITYRLETGLGRARALRLARSVG